ncbi:MAG: peptidoglycan-binding protein [Propionibacteriaceae bacterium]|nr:peptidoglycan-binding protein [Propionibacteriaceae bacterium]
MKSPAQVAADAAPPSPTTLTALVEYGTVQRTESADARIQATAPETVVPAPPGSAEKAVVSAVHVTAGQSVEAGTSLADVAGRPTFVLPGELAAYRTLGPAMTGPDVTQLQVALRGLGYQIPENEGTFGPATKEAVTALYQDRGYSATRVGDEEADAAEKNKVAAERAVATAKTTLSRAERDHKAAKDGDSGGEGQQASGADAVEDAKIALAQAKEDLEAAQKALNIAREAVGPQVPLGEVVFLRRLPAVVDSVGVSPGAEVGQGTITLASGELAAVAKFTKAQGARLAVGSSATLVTSDGTRTDGVVADVTALKPEEGQTEGAIQVTVTPVTPLDAGLRDTTVRVNVAVYTSEQETLKVPEAAIITGADGKSRVRVEDSADSFRDVEVIVGESGDGMVGITVADGSELAAGNSVVVGMSR